MSKFLDDYIATALWSSTDNADDSGGEPLDAHYSADDLAPATLASFTEDCADFETANADDLAAYQDATGQVGGHDFWLTRNGHGAGFWDRGLGALGQRLTDNAHAYGSVDLYVGDDGLIYA
jgi:hypothetical protein